MGPAAPLFARSRLRSSSAGAGNASYNYQTGIALPSYCEVSMSLHAHRHACPAWPRLARNLDAVPEPKSRTLNQLPVPHVCAFCSTNASSHLCP